MMQLIGFSDGFQEIQLDGFGSGLAANFLLLNIRFSHKRDVTQPL
jgi:hypothetical protein